MDLRELPNDIFIDILNKLTPTEVGYLSQTSKELYAIISNNKKYLSLKGFKRYSKWSLSDAFLNNHLDLVELILKSNNIYIGDEIILWKELIRHNRLDIMKYIYNFNIRGYNPETTFLLLLKVAENKNIKMLEWYNDNINIYCSDLCELEEIVMKAVKNDNLELIIWLYEHNEIFDFYQSSDYIKYMLIRPIIKTAIRYNNIRIMEWLNSNYSIYENYKEFTHLSIVKGHLEMTQWLYNHNMLEPILAITYGMNYKYYNIVLWLFENNKKIKNSILYYALRDNKSDVINMIGNNYFASFDCIIPLIIKKNNIDLIKWIININCIDKEIIKVLVNIYSSNKNFEKEIFKLLR